MIGLFHASWSTILSRAGCFVTKSPCRGYFCPSRIESFPNSGVRTVNLGLLLTRFQAQCYSSKKSSGVSSRKRKVDTKTSSVKDKEEFFVVRKGDLVGVYKSLSDCQAQAGTSICDPPVSVFKGCNMPKDTEKYLFSCGLQNALYTIRASDLTEGIFGPLASCPIQVSSTPRVEPSSEPVEKKRSHEALSVNYGQSCTLEFDGASKGNPGKAGAGAVLRSDDGSVILRLREGLGVATNNVAEYRAFILGLKCAIERGFTSIQVQGDSKLVCMQVRGLWKVNNENLSILFKEAKKLKDQFDSFKIMHVLRHLNSEADALANLAVQLPEGQVQEEIDE